MKTVVTVVLHQLRAVSCEHVAMGRMTLRQRWSRAHRLLAFTSSRQHRLTPSCNSCGNTAAGTKPCKRHCPGAALQRDVRTTTAMFRVPILLVSVDPGPLKHAGRMQAHLTPIVVLLARTRAAVQLDTCSPACPPWIGRTNMIRTAQRPLKPEVAAPCGPTAFAAIITLRGASVADLHDSVIDTSQCHTARQQHAK